MNFAIGKRVLRRVLGGSAVFAALLAGGAVLAQATRDHRNSANSNSIESIAVVTESRNSVTFEVVYTYSGGHGTNVFIMPRVVQKDKKSPAFRQRKGRIQRGRHSARVTLSARLGKRAVFSSDQVVLSMYAGLERPFSERAFEFSKTWREPNAKLKPVRSNTVVPAVRGAPPTAMRNAATARGAQDFQSPPNGGTGAGSSAPTVQILPDGSVNILYPDGTRIIRSGGCGETIIGPNRKPMTIMCAEAQPPTPPEAPPDSAHSDWLTTKNESLLGVIRKLVAFDEPSIQNYLVKEGSALSLYQRMDARIRVIGILVPPPQ